MLPDVLIANLLTCLTGDKPCCEFSFRSSNQVLIDRKTTVNIILPPKCCFSWQAWQHTKKIDEQARRTDRFMVAMDVVYIVP